MHDRFTVNEGALSIRIGRTTYKHCRACGFQMQCKPKRRVVHYRRWHGGQEPAWLGFDERPAEGCYANFEAYLANPDTELVLIGHIKYDQRGPIP